MFIKIYFSEPELLVAICVGLAKGLMVPWLPEELVKPLQIPTAVDNQIDFNKNKKSNMPGAGQNAYGKPFSVPNEANADIKKALEVRLNCLIEFFILKRNYCV